MQDWLRGTLNVPTGRESRCPGLVVVANRDRLRDDAGYQDVVRRFIDAVGKGTKAAQEDPGFAAGATSGMAKKKIDAGSLVTNDYVSSG